MIPYGRQSLNEEDIAAVSAVLRSDFLTQGPEGARFEESVGEFCGASQAIAVSSGTMALHLACRAMDLGPGDVLWTSPITFVASANCARYCGADVDFVDIDPLTGNLDVSVLRTKLSFAKKSRQLPKILVPVHLAGLPCDMAEISELSKEYGFRVLEDASHALGAAYQGQKVGGGQHSDAAVLSFHAVKMITTGEGGMVLTENCELASTLRRLRTHGITKDLEKMSGPIHGPWYYEQIDLGMHGRLTDFQAALGRSQMKRLPDFLNRRRALADRYDALLAGLPLERPPRLSDRCSSWHLYIVQMDFRSLGLSQKEFYEQMHRQGVGVQLHYIPVYRQPDFASFGFSPKDFPGAESFYARTVSLPMHCELTDAQQDQVVNALQTVLRCS